MRHSIARGSNMMRTHYFECPTRKNPDEPCACPEQDDARLRVPKGHKNDLDSLIEAARLEGLLTPAFEYE